jgi:multicomponent Na+:H+ antiporter subunit G
VSWRAVVALVLLIAGGLLELLAVLGICVMRDAYDRLHYPGLAAFGALLVTVAVVVRESFSLIGDKALAVGVFLVLSGVVLAHVTARAIRVHELGDWRIQQDEDVEVEES